MSEVEFVTVGVEEVNWHEPDTLGLRDVTVPFMAVNLRENVGDMNVDPPSVSSCREPSI
jgi:hypothetical protein